MKKSHQQKWCGFSSGSPSQHKNFRTEDYGRDGRWQIAENGRWQTWQMAVMANGRHGRMANMADGRHGREKK